MAGNKLSSIYNDDTDSLIQGVKRYLFFQIRDFFRWLVIPLIDRWPRVYYIYYHFQRLLSTTRYTDADPLKVIHVDPDNIEFTCENHFGRPLNRGAVYDGDWDRDTAKFMEREIPKTIRHYFDGKLDRNHELFSKIEYLSDSINNNGYLLQSEYHKQNSNHFNSEETDPVPTVFNEITVNIGRNGQFLWRTYGQHRLAVAKMMGIDKVPVMVCVRHEQWQNIRDKVRMSEDTTTKHNKHPDLEDLS